MAQNPHENAAPLVELWRGPILESLHHGHAVICDEQGGIVEAWGDPDAVILPRSSVKMIQALPLLTSGAGKSLSTEQLALACASHNGAAIHTDRVRTWLADLGLSDDDLRCGPQFPDDRAAREGLIKSDASPCQVHNNCSGKHCGFLTLNRHLGGGPDYVDPDHPVQKSVLEAFETVTGESSPGFGIDGCSAPNFAASLHGIARAMAWFASAAERSDTMSRAAAQLVEAMHTHPELVAGEKRACTELMRAMDGVAIKTGAEAVFIGILPEQKRGIAVKIADGSTRASEAVIAQLLVRLGALDPDHPSTRRRVNASVLNRRKVEVGLIRCTEALQ
ncbi:asparaginase [Primorskyibacter aestuariivivens]|uniref:asparaginase n=1 Tax=Primorskyibacter aestuariivivens TaxID=1888912 RepID=UPI0023004500|nr:asparaginase [Primorskyibacter aestuariivivens]MDA7429732.1 asparaginase [Primorskyibacter aestuariivivens]